MSQRIVPGHVQIHREVELREKVLELAERHGIVNVEKLHEAYAERMFAEQAQHSLCVTQLEEVQSLISLLSQRIEVDFAVHVFLMNHPIGFAATFPRKYFDGELNSNHSVVIVSQHFFNDLTATERLFVLGHEIGHIALEHYKVPANQLLSSKEIALGGSRADVAAYSICCEVSCDLVGLVAAGMDHHAAMSAMTKLTTGLNSQAIEQIGLEAVAEVFREQYESLSNSALATKVTSHPLTPSRLEVLRRFCDSDFSKAMHTLTDAQDHADFRLNLQELVSSTLADIYPDLNRETAWRFEKEASAMAWAVAMSDGSVDLQEHQVLKSLMPEEHYQAFNAHPSNLSLENASTLVDQVTSISLEKDIRKPDAVRILRKAAMAARADGKVVANELLTMHRFGRNFGLTKHEIITIAKNRWEEQSF